MITVPEALPEGIVLAWTSYLGGRPYARSWMYRQGVDERGWEHIVFLGESDLAAIGLGEPLTRGRANLFCSQDLRPHKYRIELETGVSEASFNGGISLKLGDGSTLNLPENMPDAIAGDHIGQLALLLRVHEAYSVEHCHFTLFSPEAATTFRYSLDLLSLPTSQPRCYRSSFLEEVAFGNDGWIDRLTLPKEGAVSLREPLPLPAWSNSPVIRNIPFHRYAPAGGHTFRLEDVEIPGPVVPIGATLTIPRGQGPHPAVVFIGGSGFHNRHGISGRVDLGSHEIVDALSEAGWMGVRFDTRGAGTTKVGHDALDSGLGTVIEDARAVLEYTFTRTEVNKRRVALVGHSQGGLVAMELAAVRKHICALILLATPGRPLEDVLRDQIRNRGAFLGFTQEHIQLQLDEFRKFLSLVRSGEPWDPSVVPERFWYARRARRWYADHLARNPIEMLTQVECPVLICQGGKDFQVSVDGDARLLASAAERAAIPSKLMLFENLDHVFKLSAGQRGVAEYYEDRKVSVELIACIERFLNAVCDSWGPES